MKHSCITKTKVVSLLLLISLLFGLFALSGCQIAPPGDEPPTDDLPGEDDDTSLTVPGIDNPEKYSYFRLNGI
ncbi:MAG: hypothetical protein J6Q85_04895 [Clostridia bacterium]|nr:hypothetical protein [Clostridia bacterium]